MAQPVSKEVLVDNLKNTLSQLAQLDEQVDGLVKKKQELREQALQFQFAINLFEQGQVQPAKPEADKTDAE